MTKELLEAKLREGLTDLNGKVIVASKPGKPRLLVFESKEDYKKNRDKYINSKAPRGTNVFASFDLIEEEINGKKGFYLPVVYYKATAIQG
jgi:hypothetical protein